MTATEDFVLHDQCPRRQTWTTRYEPLRVSLNFALNEAIVAALKANNAIHASDKILSLAAAPGIDIDAANLYNSIIHHSKLVELLATYVMSVGESKPHPTVEMKWGEFEPRSFLMPDGRLRRVVLVDRWGPEREQLERFSWRTAADTAATNRPMLITALVIGGARSGYRPSPWTLGYEHPQNGGIRVQRREGEFNDNWRKLYREHSQVGVMEWLKLMQADGAFEGRVYSIVEDVPANRSEVLDQMAEMAEAIAGESMRQTRSGCFRFAPCPFLGACAGNRRPSEMGWTEKCIPSRLSMVDLR